VEEKLLLGQIKFEEKNICSLEEQRKSLSYPPHTGISEIYKMKKNPGKS